jgi:glycosyltransferase involved in cell wall biosynthesis
MEAGATPRRPVFIYDKNKVGGGEHLFLRRAEAARRLGLDPVIVTFPGAMDAAYRRAARLVHVPKPLLAKCGLTPALGERLADQLAATIGDRPSSIEATGMPALYLASLLSARWPGSDHSFYAIGPRPVPRHRPPRLADLAGRPRDFLKALAGRACYGELADLAARGRFLSVNLPCVRDAETQLGVPLPGAVLHPVAFAPPTLRHQPDAARPYLLSVSRLDGGMKAYVEGLVRLLPELRAMRPELRLILVGDGPARGALEQLAAGAPAGAVEFRGSLPNEALGPLYAGCEVFVGMGTAAIEAAMHGAPVVIAAESEPRGLSPGCFGEPGLVGFGENVPGQVVRPFRELLGPLLRDPAQARAIAERGRLLAENLHGSEGLERRLRAFLSTPPSRGATLPCPWPEAHRLALTLAAGYAWRRLVVEVT